MKYIVKGTNLKHKKEIYKDGDTIDLSAAFVEKANLKDVLIEVKAETSKAKAPVKAETSKAKAEPVKAETVKTDKKKITNK